MQLYDEIPDVAKPHFAIVTRGLRRMAKLVTDASDSQKLSRGHYAPRLLNCDIVEIVRGITAEVAPTAETKGIKLETITGMSTQIMPMDKYILDRILLNLLSNAMKFTESGGIIRVILDCDVSSVTITIEDSGKGMSEDKIITMFDRYTTDSPVGSGIGLAIVKELTALLHGTVHARNNEGKNGLCVVLNFPVLDAEISSNNEELFWYNNFIDKDLVQIELSDEY